MERNSLLHQEAVETGGNVMGQGFTNCERRDRRRSLGRTETGNAN